jgi:hypothetical protein
MIYRRLDIDFDYVFGGGQNDFLTGVDAVAQAIHTRLLLFTREWWENLNEGLPMWTAILGHRSSKDIIDGLIRERILDTPNVKSISNLSSIYNSSTRAYTFTCSVDTTFGALTINGGS